MGLIAKNVSGEDFQPCPAGNHIAICTGVVSVGKHENNFNPEKAPKNEVVLMWTLPNAVREDGFPFVLTKTYTLSLHEKASLRKDLNAWRGKAFTEQELEGFNLLNILEKPCMLQINHDTWLAFEALPKWLKSRLEGSLNWADIELKMNELGSRPVVVEESPEEVLPF